MRNDAPSTNSPLDGGVLPVVMALAVMVVWGGTPLFSKLASRQIDPVMVGILRTVIAGCFALPLVLFGRHRLPASGRERLLLAFSAFAAFIAFPLMFTVGQHSTSALHGALILATLPVFTSLFGTVAEGRPVTPAWLAGCLLALGSEVLVIAMRSAGAGGEASVTGDLIVLASSAVCAMGYVAGARLTQRGYSAVSTTLIGVTGSSVVLLPIMTGMLLRTGAPHAGIPAWSSVLVLALLTSVLGYVAWYWALGRGGISRIAPIQFTQPLFGIVWAAAVLGERPAPLTLVAAGGILLGAWLALGAPALPKGSRRS